MYASNPYQQYSQQGFICLPLNIQVATALKKAAALVEEAKVAIQEEKYDVRLHKIEHASKIIMLLYDSFTEHKLQEMQSMKRNLKKFYSIILNLLDKVDLDNDLAYADQAIKSLLEMANAWSEIKREEQMPQIEEKASIESLTISA